MYVTVSPNYVRWAIAAAALPGLAGLYGVMGADYESTGYSRSVGTAVTWM